MSAAVTPSNVPSDTVATLAIVVVPASGAAARYTPATPPTRSLVTTKRSRVVGSTNRPSASCGPSGYCKSMVTTSDSVCGVDSGDDGFTSGSGTRYTCTLV